MTKVTFLGGEECGNVAFTDWRGVRFPVDKAVDLDPKNTQHALILEKARGNRFFEVEEDKKAMPKSEKKDDGLAELRAEAKDAGVKSAHLFKDETKLREAIEAIKKAGEGGGE